jgi:hypothetical protein
MCQANQSESGVVIVEYVHETYSTSLIFTKKLSKIRSFVVINNTSERVWPDFSDSF